ncbi:MAG: type II toxin-antitoxin system RelE/ParE family toxin [Gammaproteobacteria bacterium]|nr:type II toxin-antitoxin system RelE/ParE family toxin [Gammaproteobacteria bacterium]
MIWTVEWDDRARKELRKLDKQIQKDILAYLRKRIATADDPRRFGKGLMYDQYGLWRYRIREYRVVCRIYDEELTVLAVRAGHRKNIYL